MVLVHLTGSQVLYPSCYSIPALLYPNMGTLSQLLLYPSATLSHDLNLKLKAALCPNVILSQATLSHIKKK